MSESTTPPEIRRRRLAEWLSEKQMSRTELASKLGVGRAYVSLLFNPGRSFGAVAARSIEKSLFMPMYYLDSTSDKPQAVEDWDMPSDLPDEVYALVPQVEVSLSAGNGVAAGEEQEIPPLAFRRDLLQQKIVTSRKNLRVVNIRGDSMQPYLMNGDLVLIDMGQHEIKESECYAIRYGDELRVKRLLKRFDGGLKIRSDNPSYVDEDLSSADAENISILGRVLWRGG